MTLNHPNPSKDFNFRWIAMSIFLLAVSARLLAGARTIDDSFITFRYARNLLAEEGFVYNPGERVLGTTTPLFTISMALLGLVSGGVQAPFPQLALWVNALADGLTCVLLLLLGRRLGLPMAGVSAAITWAIAPFSVTFAIGGLETSVYVLLLVGMVSAHIASRPVVTAFLAALALLTRPDALILIGLIGLDRLGQVLLPRFHRLEIGQNHSQRARLWRDYVYEGAAFLAPTSLWLVFSSFYFGSPIPHSITAKSVAYRLPPEAGFVRLLQHYGTPFMEHLTFGTTWIGIGLILYLFLSLVGGRTALRASWRAWPFLVYPWLYLAIFSAANPLIFRWYMTPPLPAYMFFILSGAETILTQATAGLRSRLRNYASNRPLFSSMGRASSSLIVAVVILLPALLSLKEWRLHPDHGLTRPAPDMAWYKLELLYHQAASWLVQDFQQNSLSQPVVAAGDVGVLGFDTNARILDTVGLNSTQATKYYPLDASYYVINYAVPPDLIIDQSPDYIVILEVYGRAGLLKDRRFQQMYALSEKLPTDIYGSDGLLIFKRIEHVIAP